jgi:hypothetical protein
MTRRGVSNAALARSIGVGVGLVWKWRAGASLPTPANAAAASEALGDDNLRRTSEAARRKRCLVCRSRFLDHGRSRRKLYCGPRCAKAANARRGRASRGKSGVLAQRRLAVYQAAVAAHCRDCEPGGVCHDGACHLRDVSPLPFARMNR